MKPHIGGKFLRMERYSRRFASTSTRWRRDGYDRPEVQTLAP